MGTGSYELGAGRDELHDTIFYRLPGTPYPLPTSYRASHATFHCAYPQGRVLELQAGGFLRQGSRPWAGDLGQPVACGVCSRGVGGGLAALHRDLGVRDMFGGGGRCIAGGGRGTAAGHCSWHTHMSWATLRSGRAACCSSRRPRRGVRAGEMACSSSWRARPGRICMMLPRLCRALLLPRLRREIMVDSTCGAWLPLTPLAAHDPCWHVCAEHTHDAWPAACSPAPSRFLMSDLAVSRCGAGSPRYRG